MFNSFLSETPEVYQVIILCLVSLVCGCLFAFLYSFFKKKDGYYKDMIIAYSLFPFLVTAAVIGVTVLTYQFSGDELTTRFGRVTVALLSAVLILRFRSEQRNFEDLTLLFFLTIFGLLLGCGYIVFGLILYVVVLLIFSLFYFLKFPKEDNKNLLVSITVPEDLNYPDAFKDVFEKYCSSYQLMKVKTADLGSVFIVNYQITMKDSNSQKEFLDSLRERNSNLTITLTLNDFKIYK